MSERLWAEVDAYFDQLNPEDEVLVATRRAAEEAGLPQIAVSPSQGAFLGLLVRISGARRVLEIGTLGGYSTIWLARALPAGGSVTSLELSPHHAKVARAALDRAGLGAVADVVVGPAVDSLAALEDRGVEPFDLVFIDADKPSNPAYLAFALRLSRPGTVIVLDNAVRRGTVVDAGSEDPDVHGVRAFVAAVVEDPRLEATAVQTVGVKGYDGFVLLRVRDAD